jgi:hypothetical protein
MDMNMTEAELRQRVETLEAALNALAQYGTHHDPSPTRRLYLLDTKAMQVDEWWENYFAGADKRVREIAKEALS